MFAIITFRATGPIKTWSDMRAANVHNARTKPLAHAMPDAPPPEHLIGHGDLVVDVKAKLRGVKIDPDRLRKNGVIAYEAILSASSEFFAAGTPGERTARLADWKVAQREWALERYGPHRIASMVLHVDEKTPHIHLIVVPLEVKSDKRRTDRDVHWSLVGRTISGPGRFDEAQDAYAAAMARFGLERGVRGSGRKHEPVPVYLARMAEKEQAVDAAGRALAVDQTALDGERRQVERRSLLLTQGETRLAESEALHAAAVHRHEATRAAHLAAAAALRDRTIAFEQQVERRVGEFGDERRRLVEERAELEAARVAQAAAAAEEERRLAGIREQLAADVQRVHRIGVERDELRAELKKEVAAAAEARQIAEAQRVEAAANYAASREVLGRAEAHRDRLAPTFAAARTFRKQLLAIRGRELTVEAEAARVAGSRFIRTAVVIPEPITPVASEVLAQYAQIRARAASLCGR